ncbi:hypothetical protein T4E_1587 [Trichinella pseudospiralis]|uniref:Uncharacterized protein n=1 Tax=Trichinella pseudospiralis TaxID=6337 RepID=A0A0V0XIE5_TRIPS|nr:hypothetical protein T4E_1587 [Trichinella pseudospiralis]
MENKAILIKRSVDKAEPILAIYDEEASATSTVPLHLAIFRFSNGYNFTIIQDKEYTGILSINS